MNFFSLINPQFEPKLNISSIKSPKVIPEETKAEQLYEPIEDSYGSPSKHSLSDQP